MPGIQHQELEGCMVTKARTVAHCLHMTIAASTVYGQIVQAQEYGNISLISNTVFCFEKLMRHSGRSLNQACNTDSM